jgi:hypothetical protein
VLAGTAVIAAAVAGAARPAAAHGGGGPDATNYQTRVEAMTPVTPGLDVRAVDVGEQLELRNTTGTDVVVLGYDEEPYLRVGPDGIFENLRSPATYLNESPDSTDVRVPEPVDPTAAPEWRRIGSGDTVRWHDHRAHWMAEQDHPDVRRDPGARHVVQPWTVELRHDGGTIRVTGAVVWVPGPSPWPWLLAALVLTAAVAAVSRTRHWRAALVAASIVAIGAATAHVAGEWGATTESTASLLGASIYTIGGIALGSVAVVLLVVREDPSDATPALLMAGLVLALGTGLAGISALWHSQLPSTQPAGVVRLEIATVLGLGAGLVVAAALHLRGPARSRRAEPQRTPVRT